MMPKTDFDSCDSKVGGQGHAHDAFVTAELQHNSHITSQTWLPPSNQGTALARNSGDSHV